MYAQHSWANSRPAKLKFCDEQKLTQDSTVIPVVFTKVAPPRVRAPWSLHEGECKPTADVAKTDVKHPKNSYLVPGMSGVEGA